MTVYVEYTSPRTDVLWTWLWADSVGELRQFAAKLGVACAPGRASVVIAEPQRRRAILMGAIPVRIRPRDPDPQAPAGVAA